MVAELAVFKKNNVLYEDNIPQVFKGKKQFVVWKAKEQRDSKGKIKVSKIPYDPTGTKAKANDSSTWGSYKDALQAYEKGGYDGIGFELLLENNIVGIDLDDCIDGNGNVEPWAKRIIDSLDSYTEISPSGRGIRIFLYGNLPPDGRKKGNIEMYMDSRFLTLTGNHIKGTPLTVEERSDEIIKLHNEVWPPTYEESDQNAPMNKGDTNLSDTEIIEKAKNAKNGDKFISLYNGDFDAYPSQSEADQALCNLLVFWTGGDAERIDRIFRSSGLYREKWDKKHYANGDTYGERTINKAITSTSEVYETKGKVVPIESGGQQSATKTAVKKKPSYDPTLILQDTYNAEKLVELFGHKIRYCHSWKKWLVWDGRGWKVDDSGILMALAKESLLAQYHELASITNDKEREKRSNHIRQSLKTTGRKALIEAAQSEDGIPVTPDKLDKHRDLLNVANGIVDLSTGELLAHNPDYLMTRIIEIPYEEDAQCSSWLNFLEKIMAGNENLINYIQRCVGYSLSGHTDERCIFILHGTGKNGKSIFIETVAILLGDYGLRTPTETLMEKKYQGIPNDIARLKGIRFTYAAENERGRKLNSPLLKEMTGGDTMSARFMRGEYFDFVPEYKIWLSTNYKPKISGADDASWDRIKLIPFNIRIPENEQIPKRELMESFKSELPGILAWAVKGCLDWQKNGLQQPDEVSMAIDDYRSSQDSIGAFINDCFVVDAGYKCSVSTVRDTYKKWCADNNETELNRNDFKFELEKRGFQQKKTGIRFWEGLGISDNNR